MSSSSSLIRLILSNGTNKGLVELAYAKSLETSLEQLKLVSPLVYKLIPKTKEKVIKKQKQIIKTLPTTTTKETKIKNW